MAISTLATGQPARGVEPLAPARAVRKNAWRIIPFLGIAYLVNFLDRTSVGFAALQMNKSLGLTATQFGCGSVQPLNMVAIKKRVDGQLDSVAFTKGQEVRQGDVVLITEKLKSYAAAKREIMPGVEHRQHKGLNNRAENSHQPTRRRERIMKRFNSPRQVQRFLSIHDQVANVFSRRPNQDTAAKFHSARNQAFDTWAAVNGVAVGA